VLGVVPAATPSAQAQPNLDELLTRVAERIAEFYKRAQRVICIETSRVQPIDLTYSSRGFARIVESELRVDAEDGELAGEARVVREVRKVNGRAPREKDKKERDGSRLIVRSTNSRRPDSRRRGTVPPSASISRRSIERATSN
jgi:hypothetical protein